MPKLFAARRPVGLGLSLLLAAAIAAALPAVGAFWMTGRLGAMLGLAEADEFADARNQLLFLGAALGRIDGELRHKEEAAARSLRKEREAVVQRLRDVAARVPRDRLPADTARLIGPASAQPVAGRVDTEAPANAPRVLRTGLGLRRPASNPPDLALDAPAPLPVFVERARTPAPRAHASAAAEERSGTEQKAERTSAEKAERSRAERTRAERAERSERTRVDRAEAERARTERTEAKPTMTDQQERRHAAQ